MTAQGWAPSPGVETLAPRARQIWLALLFVLGLGYAALVPPFQNIDEVWHWERAWSVAQGDYNCTQIPVAAGQWVDRAFRFREGSPVSWAIVAETYDFTGDEGTFRIATNACKYPPVGYIPAALMTRIVAGNPAERKLHQMFWAFYGSRVGNWLWFFGCVVLALRLTRFPMPVLLFASIPMVVQQAAALNNDAFQFGAILLVGALATRTPTRRTLWSAIALIALMSAIKPINAIAASLVWIGAYAASTQGRMLRREAVLVSVAATALPLLVWLAWNHTMHLPSDGNATPLPIANVNAAAQLAILRMEPVGFVRVLGWQVAQFFTGNPIDGGWRGVLLAICGYGLVVADYVYALVLAGLLAGLLALRFGATQPRIPANAPWPLVLAAVSTVVPYFAVVTLLLYIEFTPVGSEIVFGVQGRYYLYFIAMLLFLYPVVRKRPARSHGPWAARLAYASMVLSVLGNVAALYEIRGVYWGV